MASTVTLLPPISLEGQVAELIVNPEIVTDAALRKALGETSSTPAALLPELVHFVVEFLKTPIMFFFGEREWNTLLGRVSPAPPLPPDIEAILLSQCPFSREKKLVRQTHILVYIPDKVNDELLTLNRMEELMKNPMAGNSSEYSLFIDPIRKIYGDVNLKAHWAMMTTDVIPESTGIPYDKQQTLIRRRCVEWKVPSLCDAIVCIFARYCKSREFLSNFTRCSEKGDYLYQVEVGAKVISGRLMVVHGAHYFHTHGFSHENVGVLAQRIFAGEELEEAKKNFVLNSKPIF